MSRRAVLLLVALAVASVALVARRQGPPATAASGPGSSLPAPAQRRAPPAPDPAAIRDVFRFVEPKPAVPRPRPTAPAVALATPTPEPFRLVGLVRRQGKLLGGLLAGGRGRARRARRRRGGRDAHRGGRGRGQDPAPGRQRGPALAALSAAVAARPARAALCAIVRCVVAARPNDPSGEVRQARSPRGDGFKPARERVPRRTARSVGLRSPRDGAAFLAARLGRR